MGLGAVVTRLAFVPVIMSLTTFPVPSLPHPHSLIFPPFPPSVISSFYSSNIPIQPREKQEETTTMKPNDYGDYNHYKDYDYHQKHQNDSDYNGNYEDDDYDWDGKDHHTEDDDYNGSYKDDDYDWDKHNNHTKDYDYNGNYDDHHTENDDYTGNHTKDYDYNGNYEDNHTENYDYTGNYEDDHTENYDYTGNYEDDHTGNYDYNNEEVTTEVYNQVKREVITSGRLNNDNFDVDYDTVAALSSLPQHCVFQQYPNKLQQVLGGDEDLKSPSALHPVFYGCFDWHSSVHGHWLLSRALSLFPETELANNVTNIFTDQFTKDKVNQELLYFSGPGGESFERTYGWAWLLKLQEELVKDKNARSAKEASDNKIEKWHSSLFVLADHISNSYKQFLPKLSYPIRVGEHTNTAFGLSLALDYARTLGDVDLENLILYNATGFYREDRNCPLSWEPSGYDFLSPCLQEADLMSRVISDDEEFSIWLRQFLPQLFDPDFVLEPGQVLDRTDGKLVHLDGLNFSRAWCLYSVAKRLGGETGSRLVLMGDNHVETSRDAVVGSNYMGSHWLATFLLYALEKRQEAVHVIQQ